MMNSSKFEKYCDRYMVFCFWAMIYFLPISIALVETFSGMAIATYLVKRSSRLGGIISSGRKESAAWHDYGRRVLKAYQPIENFLNRPLAAYLGINFLTVILSQYPKVSFIGFLGKVLQGTFIFFTFIECMNSRKRFKVFIVIFLLSNFLICVNGIYQGLLGKDFIYGHTINDGRIASSLRAPNDFAGYLLFTIMFVVFMIWGIWSKKAVFPKQETIIPDNGPFKIFLIVLLLLSLSCLALTFSRGAWLALILIAITAAFYFQKKMFVPVIILMVICIILPFFVFFRSDIDFQSILIDNGRIRYWKEALSIFRDFMLYGGGVNAYSLIGREYKVTWGGYPHNCYLQMLAEIGLVGFGVFLWVIWTFMTQSLKRIQILENKQFQYLSWGLFFGVAGFLVHCTWDTLFYSVQLSSLFWVYLGAVVALQRLDNTVASER